MNYGKNKHYQNKHGQELNEFLKAHMSVEEMRVWYMLQSIKYVARAGKKENESESKDLGKASDYLDDCSEITGINVNYLIDEVCSIVEDFENWKGK